MSKLKYDIDSESFDLFFQKQVEGFSFKDADIPKELKYKLYKKGWDASSVSTNTLSGIEKIYLLWKILGRKIFIIIDDKNGMNLEQYIKRRDKGELPEQRFSNNGTIHIPSTFVTADKELAETFSYYNLYFNSPAYRHALGIKNKTPNRIAVWKKEMKYMARFMLNYDAIKRRALRAMGLSIPQMYVLLYLYDEEEKKAAPLYKEQLHEAFGASQRSVSAAFKQLLHLNYVSKRGQTKTAKFKITPLGTDKLNEFFKRYVTNI